MAEYGASPRLRPALAMVAALLWAAAAPVCAREAAAATTLAPEVAASAGLAFVDPGFRSAARQEGENPIARSLEQGLERYRTRWGRLPDVQVAAGPALSAGAQGPRVASLRKRLGLAVGASRYDTALTRAVSAFQKAHGLTATGSADAATLAALNAGPRHYEELIAANLERARALPPTLGDRYILVNAAVGQLWLYDHGQVAKTMKVVVGKPTLPTPMMAGLLSTATFNPYWNVPEDLVRDTIAQRVLKEGLGYLSDQGMEVLSDYGDHPTVLDPAKVNWRDVASGAREVRVRQKPGPKNMMGVVKLAFPNPLGIYLHDTPMKELFGLDQRTASSGCIRLEDARSLATLLVGPEVVSAATASGQGEREMPLAAPVPVYVTYLTAEPAADGFVFRPDVYGRDKAWLAQQTARLEGGGATAGGGH